MKVKISKKSLLENIPSASGIEMIDGLIYIVGDDTPFLYRLDHHLKCLEKIVLYQTDVLKDARIPKRMKADLESLTNITINNNQYLLTLGSGSMANRDRGFLIKLPTKFNKKHIVKEVDLKNLYNLLRSNYEIVGDGVLNIEGAATSHDNLFLFLRQNNYSHNVCLVFNLEEIEVFLTENPEFIPFPKILKYTLPSKHNLNGGFSGACYFEGLLFITATLEDTADAISDGEILGSYIGVIKETDLNSNMKQEEMPFYLNDVVLLLEEEKPYLGKIESIKIYEKEADNFYAIAVTDDDQGGSELLMLEITL